MSCECRIGLFSPRLTAMVAVVLSAAAASAMQQTPVPQMPAAQAPAPTMASPTPPAPTPSPTLPAAALVLNDATAASWLSSGGIPVRQVKEAELVAALDTAALVVLPVQQVRQPATVEALKAYVGRGGRVLATYWGPLGARTPLAASLSSLLGVSVQGWSGRGNATITAAPAGKALFNGTGRLRLGRGYAVVAAPGSARAVSSVPNGDKATASKPNGSANGTATVAPTLAGPEPPPMALARWLTEDGRPSRPSPNDTALVSTAGTLWVGENLFDVANRTPDVRRWFLNAAVWLVPALRLPVKQAALAGAQARLEAAKAAVAAARTTVLDAGLADAQNRLDAAARVLTAAGAEMDLAPVLKAVDLSDDAAAQATAGATPTRVVEARAVWLDQASLPKAQTDIRKLVQKLADTRINVLLPEVVYRGQAAFPSTVYPQDGRYRGTDPLRVLIDEAHRRGMEVHPWVWTLCAGTGGTQGPLLRAHPEWAARDKAGRALTEGKGLMWLSPSIPAVRMAVRNVVREIAARYDVDGIHLDYLRYQNPDFDYCDAARAAYKKAAGIDPEDIPSTSPKAVAWRLWREDQLNTLLKEIRSDVAAVKPGVMLSASVYQTPDAARANRLQDWGHWLANGWLDWVAPLVSTADVAELSRWLSDGQKASCGLAYLVPGLDTGQMGTSLMPGAQVGAARAAGAAGVALYSASQLSDDVLNVMKAGAFRTPATVPWKNPLASARSLASAAADRLKAWSVTDTAVAAQVRAAIADLDAWTSKPDLASLSVVPASLASLPLGAVIPDDVRSLAFTAQQVALVASRPQSLQAHQTPPPVTSVANPLPLPAASIPLVTGVIGVDGKLDEAVWASASVISLERTYEGERAKVPTTVRVMRDLANLYIGFACTEPDIAKVKGNVTYRNGRAWEDDSVEVFLSASAKGLPYSHFAVSVAGGACEDETGDGGWFAPWTWAVAKDATSWTAEMAIPFASIDASPSGQWRVNLMRNRFAGGPEYITWSVPYGPYYTTDRFGAWTF